MNWEFQWYIKDMKEVDGKTHYTVYLSTYGKESICSVTGHKKLVSLINTETQDYLRRKHMKELGICGNLKTLPEYVKLFF